MYILIQANKPDLTTFAKRMSCFIARKQNKNFIPIDEDMIFLMLNNYYFTEQSRNKLKNAFIASGMLVPDKQITASFYIKNTSDFSSLNDTNDVNKFIERKDSLLNYAVNRYNIHLLP